MTPRAVKSYSEKVAAALSSSGTGLMTYAMWCACEQLLAMIWTLICGLQACLLVCSA